MMEITFVTTNANKLREVKTMLGDSVSVIQKAVELVEIQGSIEEIATDKARRAAERLQGPVLTEDTCLCFTALGELPGPYIKYFMGKLGLEGLNKLLAAFPDKSATAVCTFAYCPGPGQTVLIFEGRTQGKIVPARGANNFGWDPIFEYGGKTYGEMEKEEKNRISHRAKALNNFRSWMVAQ